MSRPLSPIERMIDAATGFRPASAPPRPMVTLRCPKCQRTQRVAKHETDPPNTFFVETPCDRKRCDVGGDRPETMYFDEQNRQLDPETGELMRL
jgi:hypothetical protein